MSVLGWLGVARGAPRWAALGGVLCACGPRLEIGSDLLWATSHESNDLSDWTGIPNGGQLADDSMSTVEVVAGPAHLGRYSLKFTDLAASDTIGPGVYRELTAPPDAYYSAWYYLPRLYQTKSQWTIMKFQARSELDAAQINQGHDLNLRTLPGGQLILYVFSHDPMYLQAPLVDPPAFVPIETWFHLEVMYRPRIDETGKLSVWLDDRLVYELENRRTASSETVLWAPCNIGQDVSAFDTAGVDASARVPPELYIDDAAISLRRVTRSGRLFSEP